MGDRFHKGPLSQSKEWMGDFHPRKRSKIRVKSEQTPPPFKRYGSNKLEIPWPSRIGPKEHLGSNYGQIQESLSKSGASQPGFDYPKTERESKRAAKSKTRIGKGAKLLIKAVQLPGLPEGSPSTKIKFRSGPPRAIGLLGWAIELYKDRKRIWEEAERGQFGLFYDLKLLKSWLVTQPVGTIILGKVPVNEVGPFVSDVGGKERIEKGNSISTEEFAWRKDADGFWHLIPAPATFPRSVHRFKEKRYLPQWMKGKDGYWHLVNANDKQKFINQNFSDPNRAMPPPTYKSGGWKPGTSHLLFDKAPGGITRNMFKPNILRRNFEPSANYGPKKVAFQSHTQIGPINPYKTKTIFDPPDPGEHYQSKTTAFRPRSGSISSPSTGAYIGDDIRLKFQPTPIGRRLPQLKPTFTNVGGVSSPAELNYHTVRRGENLSRIAHQYGSTVNDFAQDNPWLHNRHGRILKGINYIRPGDRLKIPDSGFNR